MDTKEIIGNDGRILFVNIRGSSSHTIEYAFAWSGVIRIIAIGEAA